MQHKQNQLDWWQHVLHNLIIALSQQFSECHNCIVLNIAGHLFSSPRDDDDDGNEDDDDNDDDDDCGDDDDGFGSFGDGCDGQNNEKGCC